MHRDCLPEHEHTHTFGQELRREGERRTHIVIVITALTMVGEIIAGLAFGSMALLADGLHMGSHAVALGIAAFAYAYARRKARDPRFAFGTGKVNALGGFAGAILLAVFAVFMAVESVGRLLEPVPILFDQAIFVAVIGLIVNIACAFVLGFGHGHGHSHAHGHGHHHDHNLRSAYLHVLADAVTSLAAIVALVTGKYMGWTWMDPTMGILGSLLVARWSVGLVRQTSNVLLDHQAPQGVRDSIRAALEQDGDDHVSDLHVWSVGPGIWAVEGTVLTEDPQHPDVYKGRIPPDLGVVHATLEVVPCRHEDRPTTAEAP
ncbi:MAG: CDF family Co(II)/Ni(II) efflux transporter DmeF [Planctomycetota bacterium]|nr:CDF family Co(II)/Ni(II) efflux transporter DmeF [Planctomycetota bacterium]